MNKVRAIVGAVLAGGAIAAGLLLGGGDTGAHGGNATAEAGADVRAARLDGICPEAMHGGKEQAECLETIQSDGFCICLTRQGAGHVDGEVNTVSGRPPKDRHRLVVCGDGIGHTTARWEPSDMPVPASCTVAVEDALMPGISASVALGDTDAKLRAVCAPCQVTAGSWGPCPHCLRWPGGCASACTGEDHVPTAK